MKHSGRGINIHFGILGKTLGGVETRYLCPNQRNPMPHWLQELGARTQQELSWTNSMLPSQKKLLPFPETQTPATPAVSLHPDPIAQKHGAAHTWLLGLSGMELILLCPGILPLQLSHMGLFYLDSFGQRRQSAQTCQRLWGKGQHSGILSRSAPRAGAFLTPHSYITAEWSIQVEDDLYVSTTGNFNCLLSVLSCHEYEFCNKPMLALLCSTLKIQPC